MLSLKFRAAKLLGTVVAMLRIASNTLSCRLSNTMATLRLVVVALPFLIVIMGVFCEDSPILGRVICFILLTFFSILRPFSERPLVAENAVNSVRVAYLIFRNPPVKLVQKIRLSVALPLLTWLSDHDPRIPQPPRDVNFLVFYLHERILLLK